MLLNRKPETDVDRSSVDAAPESIGAALQMAIAVRLQVAVRESVEPAAARLLEELGERLNQVPARRHAVDFELAKAVGYWRGVQTDDLIRRTRQILAADPELRRFRERDGVESVVFDHHVQALAREAILDRIIPLERNARLLRDNRLNVQ